MRLHNICANPLQRPRRILEIAHLVPDLRAAPHPHPPIVHVMRHVGVRPVEQALPENLVDGRCVDTGWDRQGHIHLCGIASRSAWNLKHTDSGQNFQTNHIQSELVLVFPVHDFRAEDLRHALPPGER